MSRQSMGFVYLVGGGPGDPGLLTLRGRECLERADLVLYDGLVSPFLLRYTHANCERTSRMGDQHSSRLDQEAINQQLIAAAREGKTVVRLKGGDPFLFGRGSEEAAALAAAGIPFEVVPGVTAALAASTYAGLSLTHRRYASCVALATGHEDPMKDASSIDYEVMSRFPGTLVFYMGLHRLPQITQALIESGKPPQTPACVVCRASTPSQRTVTSTLAELPDKVANAGLHAPSLIIVGETVVQRESIAWFEAKSLFGQRIAVTRPVGQADGVVDRLLEMGAEPVSMPLLEVVPPPDWGAVDRVMDRLGDYSWLIFTSANGVRFFLDRVWERGLDSRVLSGARIACIGPATARALGDYHLRPDLVPDEFRAEGLAAALKGQVAGERLLWIGADRGRDVLLEELERVSAGIEKVVTYVSRDVATLSDDTLRRIERQELDWIPLSSPAMARGVHRLVPPELHARLGESTRLASISPVTTEAANLLGLPISAEATEYTWPGLIAAIKECVPTH